MNRWLIRGLLFALLLASVDLGGFLGSRVERGADTETSVRHLLAHYGMSYRETRSFSDGALTSMIFDVPLCDEPLQVAPSPRTFDASPLFDRVGAPGDIRLFAYLSQVSEREDRFSFFLEHLKQSLLGVVAMTPYQPDGMMLMISEPRGCTNVPDVAWSLVWKTDYRLSVARDLNPSGQ
jgi:hypothetical protein